MPHAPHLLGASYIVLLKDDRVLLQRRFQTGWMDGMYSLPAGHIESGENATEALIREIKEEIGIQLQENSVTVSHVMHRFYDTQHQYLDIFYTCTTWEGEPTICEPEKCDALEWFLLADLPSNTIPYIQKVLRNIQMGIVYSEDGW